MALSVGTRLGSYEIVNAIGAGGMGEVYRARDTRLGRDVAIKVLPAAFSKDADRLRRFEQEARAAGMLNHPNILIVHDIGTHEGAPYIVSELLSGETLRERLAQGPLPARRGVDYALQIARGLAAAHEKGIVHRDLKPENLFVTKDGRIKILDFGLAKLKRPGPGVGGVDTNAPTYQPNTEPGVVMGTVWYMSPEQVRGQDADHRSDIFAFGTILYEMLAGKRPFEGASAVEVMNAILKQEPPDPPETGRHVSHPGLERVFRHCLEKDPQARFQSASDLAFAIDALSAPSGAHVAVASGARAGVITSPLLSRAFWIGATAVLLITTLAMAWWRVRPEPASARNVVLQRVTDFVGMEEAPSVSPDGKTVAFVARAGGKRQIWIRLLAGGTPLQITRDEGDHEQPRWTPDSSGLIYYSPTSTPEEQGAVYEISALGGPPRRLVSAVGGGDISHDGRRVAIFELQNGSIQLSAVRRDGSGTEKITQLPAEYLYSYPRWSPDDRWVAFQRASETDFDIRLYIVPAARGEPREVARGDDLRGLSWLPDGSGLVYSSSLGSTVLYPPTFNLRTIRRDGTGERQLTFGDVSYVEPDVHTSGRLSASRIRSQSDIWKFPIGGSPAENTRAGFRVTQQTGVAQTPSVSPDGKELVYLSDSGGHGNLWIAQADGSGVRQITFERDPAVSVGVPVWSPAGSRIAFVVTQLGKTGLSLINRDGSGLRMLARGSWASWSGDGRWLYYSPSRDGPLCIEKIPVDGGAPVPVRCDNAGGPAVAADGSTLYFITPFKGAIGGGDWEVRKASPETGPSQVLARVAAARVPVESLLMHMFLSPDGSLLALPLTDGTTSNIWALPTSGGPMRLLTDFGERSIIIARRVSWSPDGRHIYAAVAETDADVVLLDGLLR